MRDKIYSREFRAMNGRAHKQPADAVAAPALVWHLTFWLPRDDGEASSGADWISRRDRWHKRIDAVLAEMFRQNFNERDVADGELLISPNIRGGDTAYLFRSTCAFKKDPAVPLVLEPIHHGEDGPDDRYECVTLRFRFEGVRVKVRAILHSEYLTLTFSAELSRYRDPADGHANAFPKHFSAILAVAQERWKAAHANSPADMKRDEHIAASQNASVELFDGFWSRFEKRYLADVMRAWTVESVGASRILTGTQLGEIVADFRIAVLHSTVERAGGVPAQLKLMAPLSKPTKEHLRAYNGKRYRRDDALDLVDAYFPLLEAADMETDINGERKSRHAEFAVATFEGGKYIYLSALGSQKLIESKGAPVRCLMITANHNRWQLGRIIERINWLGTLRLASLRDLAALSEAGDALRTLGDDLTSAETDLFEERLELHRIDQLYNDLDEVGHACDGGLQYRAERSNLYSSVFAQQLRYLRMERVRGFQTYGEFVNRRLGTLWTFIGSLGKRLERARRRLDSINGQFQTIKQVRLAEAAEWVAGAAVAYYLGTVLYYVFKALTIGEYAPDVPIEENTPTEIRLKASMMVLAGLAYLGVLLFVRPSFRKAKRETFKALRRLRSPREG